MEVVDTVVEVMEVGVMEVEDTEVEDMVVEDMVGVAMVVEDMVGVVMVEAMEDMEKLCHIRASFYILATQ